MCELEAQKTLFTILSSLHHQNLSDDNMEFFQKNSFDYSFEVKEPVSILEKYILERFCKQAALDLPREHGREFEFRIEGNKPHGLDLSKVGEDLLPRLPT